MKIKTTQLNARAGNITVIADKKYGDAKTYLNATQANKAADKLAVMGVDVKVTRPAMSRCFYLQVG